MDPIFIIGTGRCGSTLLSDMLSTHPKAVSISEFFSFVTDLGCRVDASFPAGDVTGEAFWKLIASPHPRQNLMIQHQVVMDEVLYPWQSEQARFRAPAGVPAICQITLPHLTDTPDALYDVVEAFVLRLPPAPIGQQCRTLFEWLARRAGKSAWVERSGGGLRITKRLIEHFPGARFVHIVRDGRNTALSMSRHLGFRMVFAAFQMMEMLGVDPFESSDRRWEEDLPDDLAALLPERFTREAFLAFETPSPLCGHYWAGEVMEGIRQLGSLPPERLLTLRYEDFLEAPERAVRRLDGFLFPGETHAGWIQESAARVGRGRSAWQSLSPRDRQELERACAPGFEALARHGVTWE